MRYNKGCRIKYWEIKYKHGNKKGNDCIIRSTDNSGQISNECDNKTGQQVGNCLYGKKMSCEMVKNRNI